MEVVYGVLATALVTWILYLFQKRHLKNMYWEWDNGGDNKQYPKVCIDQDVENFKWPIGFLWGTATAAHQIEGYHTSNNWSEFEKQEGAILNNEKCGASCDHWNRVEEDIRLMKQIHMNSYRFSVSWSKIQPTKDSFDSSVLDHYRNEIELLLRNGITPMITLHHFTEPLWFTKLGGFQERENIPYFVRFARRVFEEFQEMVDFWCTFNEPAVYVLGGWVDGCFPPAVKDDLVAGMNVLSVLLSAHTETYCELKRIAKRDTIQIGMVKNIFHIDPYNVLNPLDNLYAYYLDDAFNGVTLRYLETGRFESYIPGGRTSLPADQRAPLSFDFLGLNYYSQYLVKFTLNANQFQFVHREGSIKSDMPQSIYAEGLYRALVRISKVGKVPIYVTENGIADKYDDRRHMWIRRHLTALHRAIQDGIDCRGFFYWSLLDNFEWAEGFSMKFGLYAVDFQTQKRTLRDGAKVYSETARKAQGL